MRELAERARNGDQEAFAGLYREVYEDLYRFALYVLKNPHDAQDAAAETVADAYASVGKLRKPEAFRPWIFKILTNKCKRRLKEYSRRDVELTEEILSGEILAGEQDTDLYFQVRQAFFSLEWEERLIISMKIFGGFKSEEIGQILHKSHNTVRSRLSRALKKMEEKLR